MKNEEILLKEYDSLRSEVLERIKIAFSHMGYAGAVAAFGVPAADKVSGHQDIAVLLAIVGFVVLARIAYINWSWVERIASHLRVLEERINRELGPDGGTHLLAWEGIAGTITRGVFKTPKEYPGASPRSR